MLRKKKKRPKPSASSHTGLAFSKGPTREQAKHEKRQRHNEVVAATRELVFRLDPVCILCGRGPFETDEMHEVIPRSKTRGMPPEERFNRRNCVRLCRPCHCDVTEKRVRLDFVLDSKGVDGGLWLRRTNLPLRTRFYKRTNGTQR